MCDVRRIARYGSGFDTQRFCIELLLYIIVRYVLCIISFEQYETRIAKSSWYSFQPSGNLFASMLFKFTFNISSSRSRNCEKAVVPQWCIVGLTFEWVEHVLTFESNFCQFHKSFGHILTQWFLGQVLSTKTLRTLYNIYIIFPYKDLLKTLSSE